MCERSFTHLIKLKQLERRCHCRLRIVARELVARGRWRYGAKLSREVNASLLVLVGRETLEVRRAERLLELKKWGAQQLLTIIVSVILLALR